MTKLWGGRFADQPDELMRAFGNSIGFDVRLWEADIAGSIAYARALSRAGVIDEGQCDKLLEGLGQVRNEFAEDRFVIQPGDEDIHTAVERRLGELIGPGAGTLHTGRSRNDQVATDTRLYLRDRIADFRVQLVRAQRAIVRKIRGSY